MRKSSLGTHKTKNRKNEEENKRERILSAFHLEFENAISQNDENEKYFTA